jgi:ATP-dependent helicase/nuclease subunit B
VTFAAQLAALCREHPTRSKWVFVPSHGVGRTIGDRLVLDGTDWANLRVVTPLDVALRMGAPFLVERGIDPSEEGLGPALIMRLLLGLPEASGYFRPLANQPQMAIALWSTIRELRMAGVEASGLTATGFASVTKFEELRALLGAYESYLAANRRGDRATVFVEAMRHPDWCPIKDADCWTTMPDVVWSKLERDLHEAMPGARVVPRSIAIPGATLPRRLHEFVVERDAPSPTARLSFLLAPGEATNPASAGPRAKGPGPDVGSSAPRPAPSAQNPAPALFTAGGAEAEVEEVFRRILAAGATLDDVEIACASPAYSTLIWEKACRYDWPVTLATGLPATLTRPGRALLGFTEWIEDDFAAGLLRRLLESGDVHLGTGLGRAHDQPRPVPLLDIAPGRAARLLVKAKAAWGRRTFGLAFDRMAKAERTRARRDDIPADERDGHLKRADEAEALAAAIDAMIDLVPEPDAHGDVDFQALVRGAETFVDRHAARASALDAAAATVLRGALAELEALGEFRGPPGLALRFVRERVEGLTVGADRPRPGHLHVSRLSQAGLPHRRHLFVVGLEEGRVFPATFEDPILLDAERKAIGPSLALATDRTDEAVYAALARLAATSAAGDVHVCLSYSCRDLRQFRESYASWLMLQAYRVMTGDARAPYKAMHDALATPKSAVPESPAGALSPGRWWLHGVTRGSGEAGRTAVLAHYPPLAAGLRAAEARASDRFTEYDGHVPEAGLVLDPAAAGVVVSPTRLEGAAKCPFKFFLERGLGVKAIESGERSRDAWLDPLIRGSLLHDLYAGCLRRCRDETRRASVGKDRDWLMAEARRRLDELRREMPAPSADVETRETDDLLADLDLFLAAESGLDEDREPLGFEVSFGQAGGGGGEPLASDDPIEVSAGGVTFRIAGRVDRIDRIDGPKGPAFQILDYKTGGFWRDDWTGTFAGGRLLQHALYGLAVAELLRRAKQKGRVSGAEYYFSSTKGRQQRKMIPAPPAGDVARVLCELREVIVQGLFVHTPSDRECKFCDYGHACGPTAHEQADAKLGDPALAPYQRLAAHE